MKDRTKSGIASQRSILAGLALVLVVVLAIVVSSATGPAAPIAPSAGNSYFVVPTGSDSNSGTTEAPLETIQKGVNTAGADQSFSGNTYYVSTTGSDSNPGTASAPFRTIRKGVGILNPGDTLLIRSGTYLQTDTLTASRSGRSDARITISTAPNETQAIISGDANGNGTADPADVPGSKYDALVHLSASYITFQNLEVAYSGGRGIETNANNIVSGNNVHNVWGEGIYAHGPNNLIENNTVWRAGDSNYCGGVGGSRGCNGGWPGAIAWGTTNAPLPPGRAPNTAVRNNTLYHNSGESILCMQSDGGLVEGNVSYDNWGLGIYLDQCSSTTIRKNFVYYTGDNSWWRNSSSPASGIMLSNEGNGGDAYIGHDRTIINNIVVGAGVNLDFWTGHAAGSALVNDLIANNTFVEAQNGTGIKIDPPASGASHTNTRIADNLVLQSSGTVASVASTTGLTFANNLWSRTPPSNVSSSTDVVANPLLADPNQTRSAGGVVADWYKLTAGSPAIGKGAALSQVTDDYFGDLRSASPDIGAHQYQGSITATPSR